MIPDSVLSDSVFSMNGADVRVNGNGMTSSNMAEVDPDILAAIAASKEDHEEEDPAVLAAIEASKQEVAGTECAKVVEEKKEEPKKETKGPILMFSTLGRSTEPYDDEDDTFDRHVTEEPAEEVEEETGKEEVAADDDGDVAEPGDLDPDDAELPAADLDNGEEGGGGGGGGKKKKEDFLTPTLRRAYITKVNNLCIQSLY